MSARALLLLVTLPVVSACSNISTRCPSCDSSEAVAGQALYITFEHPFTDAAADEVGRRAQRICDQRKKLAVKSTSTCSLAKCTTHYQCVDKPRPQSSTPPQAGK